MQEKDRFRRKIVFCGEIAGFACCKVMPGCCIVILALGFQLFACRHAGRYGDAIV
ncbi:MAG TPA: hypothetical protein VMW78_02945 [Anaerolineae bacterium]|nr:hypothetical protein [Anaerolineae bacterium]